MSAVWQTGTPPVEAGHAKRFWCACERSMGRGGYNYKLLYYGNRYLMELGDGYDVPPAGVVAVNEDDNEYEWTCWFSDNCDNCETCDHYGGVVVAWMELPKYNEQPPQAEAQGRPVW